MALQTFTTGQVLTALQVSNLQANDYNQTVSTKTANYVLTIADLGSRVFMNAAGATTITVNTGIFAAGDTLWLGNIGAGACVVTAGTATVSKFSTASLTLSQYQGAFLYFVSTGVAILYSDAAGAAFPVTTKGDLFGYDTAAARIPIGANDTVLTADSAQALGLKWAAPGGMTLLETITFAGAATYTSATIAGTYKDLKIYVKSFKPSTDAGQLNMRINGDSGANYNYDAGTNGATVTPGNTSFPVTYTNDNSVATGLNVIQIDDYASAQLRHIFLHGAGNNATTTTDINTWVTYGIYKTTTAITTLTFFAASGNLTSGTVQIYGVK
jgi:hypothetical protein